MKRKPGPLVKLTFSFKFMMLFIMNVVVFCCSKSVVRNRKFLRGKKKFNMDPKKVSLYTNTTFIMDSCRKIRI